MVFVTGVELGSTGLADECVGTGVVVDSTKVLVVDSAGVVVDSTGLVVDSVVNGQ